MVLSKTVQGLWQGLGKKGVLDLTGIEFQMTDNILIARVTGDLDHHSAKDVREQIDDAMRAFFAKHLVFDFSKMAVMDSSGIGVVMGRYNKIRE